MEKKKCTAIVLAAGSGRRMNSNVAKQFMLLQDKPLIYYSLDAVETSEIIDNCILVTGKEDIVWVKKEIVEKYKFHKIQSVIAGGEERYASVAAAMRFLSEQMKQQKQYCDYVFIHDGARPFLTESILERTFQGAVNYHACVAAMPSKDTVKIVDEDGFARITPERKRVWNVQTPQVFETSLIVNAYAKLEEAIGSGQDIMVTDDASVVELFANCKVKLIEGSYENIKITTVEDLHFAESLLNR